MGRAKNTATAAKASRFKPPDTARVPALQLVVYELLSLLRESAEPQVRERLIALQRRIPILVSEVDLAQELAEQDGEEVEDTQA